ncbi:energy transducer TonB [Erythrobacter insulae]|uniref:Energy transducer TonB n=1 Tax=Erythrobacter insulae TaxID=2584124 RepID=A0A547P918_9SPHN|nr:energy transducer TonB [Erythrobacter insulae]TRD10640.1 energy transducer TonB [Erythrobacter insulae]
MSYAQKANRTNPVAIMGALGVPAAFGVLLVTGLAIHQAVAPPDPRLAGYQVPIKPPQPPPPPPEPQQQTAQQQTVSKSSQAPVETTFNFEFVPGPATPIETLPDLTGGIIGPIEIPGNTAEIVPPTALPDPIAASPRGNPGEWVTDNDYRSTWIRREMSGVAGFSVTIDTNGRVSGCTITRSTGHSQLDDATCKLLERRARFNPAKDSNGKPVSGTYRNSVNWRLPD